MEQLQVILAPAVWMIFGVIVLVLIKKFAGEWLPLLFHKGRLVQILEEVQKVYSPKFDELLLKIDKNKTDINKAWDQIRNTEEEINALEKVHGEKLTRLETLREEDKSLIREVKESVTRMEERIDNRISRLEDKLIESQREILRSIRASNLHDNVED